ncbi:MAG: PLP-dependent aminotransferase family protein [Solirubrobacteraceae bacterium]
MNDPAAVDQPASILPAPGTISLARGIPATETFPVEQLAQCSARAIEYHGRVVLNYGDPQGFPPLCEWLAERHGVTPEQILITPGSIMGLSFLARVLLEGNGRAAIEAPCYDRMIGLLGRLGAEVIPVARTSHGLDLDELRRAFAQRSRPGFFYVLPTFHNPMGLTMTLGEREALVDLALELEIVVIEDDPYGLLRVEGDSLPLLHELLRQRDAGHLAVHLSSFSKTVSPGMRVGYVVAPVSLQGRLRALATATYVSPPLLAQAELYEYLRAGHLEPHLAYLQSFLRVRRDALLEVFGQRMPPDAQWTRPQGGYFLWLDLPPRIDAATLARRSAAVGVTIIPGNGFFPGSGGEYGARLSFSFPSVEEIRAGAERLAELVSG